ncbi:hypothetical protein CJP74_06280 [Psittacicella melopsittaci]|uniref:YCII-related domain-containing protein n=1 Tax=Psittacicella melopsittaci TaxID=2028576 RepID=A0A3A1Y3F9_9GAMM|nr:YciI family protein [Psittacicella melopsittaci]RIY31776.1 hypothetical protein CJP74_06280 [Psittacicella melopsittaci]
MSLNYYVIFSTDHENVLEKRLAARPDHLARLQELKDQGRLLVAGPNPKSDADPKTTGFAGSTVIAQFASLEEAQQWADQDPYLAAGVYKSVEVRPYIVVFEK